MPLTLDAGAITLVSEPSARSAALALGGFADDLGALDPVAGPALRTALGFDGTVGQTAVIPGEDDHLVVIVGLGERAELDGAALRRACLAAAQAAATSASLAVLMPNQAMEGGLPADVAVGAAVDGILSATYRFVELRGDPGTEPALARVEVVVGAEVDQMVVERATAVATGVALTRDLVNRPGGSLSAADLAAVAAEVAAGSDFLEVESWDRARCEAERLGGLLGVNAGSDEEPRLIHLSWTPPGLPDPASVALVGKGITFDSGGLSLKTSDGMKRMKTDMAGAAAIVGAMSAVAAISPPVRVDAWIAATDNMPSGTAIKVGDVLTIRNGTTVEVLNTDAEGRLVLADALSLAVEREPGAIVDLATLTGACLTALGAKIAGVMGNDDTLVDAVRNAASSAGEEVWPLPLSKLYRSELDSKIADLRNIGEGARGGAIKAGLFLQEFVGDVPWAHLDVAGPVFTEEEGATGYGVRLLLEFLGADD